MTMSLNQEFPSPGPDGGTRTDQQAAVPAGTSPHARQTVAVALPSEIDVTNVSEVRDALARALEGGTAVVIADAAETTFCDCAGVRALVTAHRQAVAAGKVLRVAAVTSRKVRRVLELTGADQVLAIYPTLVAAARANPPANFSRSQPEPTPASSTTTNMMSKAAQVPSQHENNGRRGPGA